MMYRYVIEPENNLFRKTYEGTISVEDEINLLTQVLKDPDYRKGMNAICDFSKARVDWGLGDIDHIRAYIAKIKDQVGKCKWALITTDSVSSITARIFLVLHEAFQDTITIKLFSNEIEAMAWIDSVNADNPTV